MKIVGFFLFSACLVLGPAHAQPPLRIGDRAPDFTLPGATKDTIFSAGVNLRSSLGDRVVILAFYPADWSGGCTKEMCMLRDNFVALRDLGATVFGISGDYVYSHREWARHLDLPFTLLSDHDHAVARAYGSYQEGRGSNARTVYVIDSNGTIAYIDPAYKAAGPESFDALKRALVSIH
jgi:peroxiredoxin Q/BCP